MNTKWKIIKTATQVYYSSEIYDPIMGFGGYADAGELATDIIDNLQKNSSTFS